MLGIKLENGEWRHWWLGHEVPERIGRVVEFQADGDELQLFLAAMIATSRKRGVRYSKIAGFTYYEVDD